MWLLMLGIGMVLIGGAVLAIDFLFPYTDIRCPKCKGWVNYLTGSLEGEYPSVCEECARDQYQEKWEQAESAVKRKPLIN